MTVCLEDRIVTRLAHVLVAAVLASSLAFSMDAPKSGDVERALSSGPTSSSAYVALGDSYAAGYGLPNPTGMPAAACGQSGDDYPHRVAQRLGLELTDVSCAGATTTDILSARQYDLPPQIDALSGRTRTVTVSIGGNDAGVFGAAASCFALSATGPVLSDQGAPTCRSTFVRDGVDSLTAKIRGAVSHGLADALRGIRDAAPNAQVVVVGYPTIFPDPAHTPAGGCFRPAVDIDSLNGSFPSNAFPFTDVDVRYLHEVQNTLDQVTRTTVRSVGATYVSLLASTANHSACSSAPFVNGIQLSAAPSLRRIDLVVGSLHPNEAGAEAMATAAEKGIRIARAQAAREARSDSPSPSPSPSRAAGEQPPAVGALVALGAALVLLIAGVFATLLVAARRRRAPRGRGRERRD